MYIEKRFHYASQATTNGGRPVSKYPRYMLRMEEKSPTDPNKGPPVTRLKAEDF